MGARVSSANRPALKFNLMASAHEQTYIGFMYATLQSIVESWRPVMSSTSAKIALAFVVFLAAPAASFARMAGEAGMGNVPISGIPQGPANAGGMNNVMVNPSGIGNGSRIAAPPPPRISVPAIPRFK
jgi:hypothetical protein